ncbi:prolyl oligopeptidase family serine peptidase [Aquimarina sp. BL5]|uniref:prolyl oligopeptidase family serine peptidase n=1 Tax=Aquimarina sp. BL5 TaxID=1714860 RepID=UPI001314BE73|nr:prolyl oligopeptidase family serine peptidase [Aquimarina sp. BL5]
MDSVKSPKFKKQNISEIHFGQQLSDPYRALENLDDSLVKGYLKEYNEYSNNLLGGLEQKKQLIKDQNVFEKRKGIAYRKIQYVDDNIIYLKRKAQENYFKLCFINKSKNSNEILLLDPKTIDQDYKINYFKPSWDFSHVAISLTKNGDEFSKIIVLDVKNRNVLPVEIINCAPTVSGGINWLQDNSGFIYLRFSGNDSLEDKFLNSKSVIYTLGEKGDKFQDVFSKKNNKEASIQSNNFPVVKVYKDVDKYLFGHVAGAGSYHDAYFRKYSSLSLNSKWNLLFEKSEKIKDYFLKGDTLVYKTAKNASNFKICKTSIVHPDFSNSEVIVGEKQDQVIQDYIDIDNNFFYSTVKNGVEAKMFTISSSGDEKEISIPMASGKISFEKTNRTNLLAVYLQGWITPKTRYLYDINTLEFIKDSNYPANLDIGFDDLVVEEILVKSSDGKEDIPLSLVYKKGLKKDGTTPVLMRAYGSYGISMTPNFYYGFLLWAEKGGIYAVAHVRGGREKGDAWYYGGYKTTKPNSWKDFIDCTEYLIDNKYTSSTKMAIWSGSAGGIVIGRAITERPELYAAAIIDRGCLNTTRLHVGANGANNAREFGKYSDSIDFKNLYKMDSYHHIERNVKYPSMLITTGFNDSRLPPWHSIKFATKLNNSKPSDNLVLLKTEFDSGHGMVFDKKDKEFNMVAEVLSFALWQTGHPDYQLKD